LPQHGSDFAKVGGASPSHTTSDADHRGAAVDEAVVEPGEHAGAASRTAAAGPQNSGSNTLYYSDYLHLDALLSAQEPKSAQGAAAVHDEYLFIVVHQTCELWFKQILIELDSVLAIMSQERVAERDLGTALSRLLRINEIQRLLVAHIDVLETMTPLDFLDFRSYLTPASGFQSVQFRLIENRFGLLASDRVEGEGCSYAARLRDDDAQLVDQSEHEASLCDHIERWLTRAPFLKTDTFDFAARYKETVELMHASERTAIDGNPRWDAESRQKQLKALCDTARKFEPLFDRVAWDEMVEQGERRLSYDAFMAALFINLYRDEPMLQLPYQILAAVIEIDKSFTIWRQRHALMAHRMLGGRVGTAGSGYAYLEETAKRYRAFKDLFDLPTYFLPRSALPPLPDELSTLLDGRTFRPVSSAVPS
jgi:tryptophan 2,3-dioxygenase